MNRIDHINIVTREPEAHIQFFETLFSFRVVLDCELSGKWIAQVMGKQKVTARCVMLSPPDDIGARIELLQFITPRSNGENDTRLECLGMRHFGIQVGSVKNVVLKARQLGYKSISKVPAKVPKTVISTGKRFSYIQGPEGIVVEACDYGSYE